MVEDSAREEGRLVCHPIWKAGGDSSGAAQHVVVEDSARELAPLSQRENGSMGTCTVHLVRLNMLRLRTLPVHPTDPCIKCVNECGLCGGGVAGQKAFNDWSLGILVRCGPNSCGWEICPWEFRH